MNETHLEILLSKPPPLLLLFKPDSTTTSMTSTKEEELEAFEFVQVTLQKEFRVWGIFLGIGNKKRSVESFVSFSYNTYGENWGNSLVTWGSTAILLMVGLGEHCSELF